MRFRFTLPQWLTVSGLSLIQGVYFLAGGVWPILHMNSFLALTGPKTDLWLVKTVGMLLAVMGISLLMSGVRASVSPEIRWLAAGGALALAGVEVVYVLTATISPVYLLDALVELGFVSLWVVLPLTRKPGMDSVESFSSSQ